MKRVFVSKIVWVNVILSLLAVADMVSASPIVPPEYLPFIALFSGVLTIVLRVWFTSEPIYAKK